MFGTRYYGFFLGEVIKSRKSFEAERRRAMGEIQRLRKEVAKLNSQMSEVSRWYFTSGPGGCTYTEKNSDLKTWDSIFL